jgi:hypothetical protein
LKDLEVDDNNLKPIGHDGTDWIYLALEVEKWLAFENKVLKLRIT